MAEAEQPATAPVSSCVSSTSPSDNSTPEECPVAYLETPEGRKIAYRKREGSQPGVVFLHGMCSSMMGEKATELDKHCRSNGISFLRFDLSGHGESSETKFTSMNVSTWLEDLTAVMDSLTNGPQVLVGSSLGGWLVFLYTMRNPECVAGLVGIASAVDFTQRLWKGLDKPVRDEVKRSGVYHMPSPYMKEPVELTMEFIMDGEKHGILDMPGVEIIKTPVCLLHGKLDTTVPYQVSIELMHKLQCSVELKLVEGGDHRLATKENIELLIEAVDSVRLTNQRPSKATVEEDDDD